MNLIAYLRVSTAEQGDSGLGLAAQRRQINAYARAHDHRITQWQQDISTGKTTNGRPGLASALSLLASSQADGLIVAKLDRASRSIIDGAQLLQRSQDEHWAFISLDVGMDTSTATGRMLANLMLVLAQWERELISERTSAALQELKQQGRRLGRPSTVDPKVRAIVASLRARGWSQERIADHLNEQGYTTAQGARWRQPTVRRVLRTIELDKAAGQ